MTRRIAPLAEAEWRALANHFLSCRRELFRILDIMSGHVSIKTMDAALMVVGQFDPLRNTLNDEMINQGVPEDETIFYPDLGEIPEDSGDGIPASEPLEDATWRDRAINLMKKERGPSP